MTTLPALTVLCVCENFCDTIFFYYRSRTVIFYGSVSGSDETEAEHAEDMTTKVHLRIIGTLQRHLFFQRTMIKKWGDQVHHTPLLDSRTIISEIQC